MTIFRTEKTVDLRFSAIFVGVVLIAIAVTVFSSPYVLLALIAAAVFIGLSAAHPRIALATWIISCGFVPFWIGLSTPFYLPPTSIIGILVLFSAFYKVKWSPTKLDIAVLVFCFLCFIYGVVGIARGGDVTNVLTQWLLSFVVARMLVQRTGLNYAFNLVAIVFTAVAICAIIEFFANWNPFYSWVADNAQYVAWGHEQDRGGIVRAEWAFGHSIALGCSLAMAIPLTAATTFAPRWKALMYALLLIGAIVSFSRSGGAAAVLALSLVLLVYKDETRNRGRLLLVGVMAVVGWFAIPKIAAVFQAEGRLATVSSDYRLTLTDLIPTMNPFGLAKGYTEPKAGEFYFEGFKSIDSTFILLGVSFGYILASAALIGSAILLVRVLRGTSSAISISLVAIIPTLFTVALITQFGSFVWFVIGLLSFELSGASTARKTTAITTESIQNRSFVESEAP